MQNMTKEGIASFFEEIVNAWNRHDLKGVCSYYAENALFVAGKKFVTGRQAIFDLYREIHPDAPSMGFLTMDIINFRPFNFVSDKDQRFAATVFLKWKLDNIEDETITGFSVVTVEELDNKQIFVTKDVSL